MYKYLALVLSLGLCTIANSAEITRTCYAIKNHKEVAQGSCNIKVTRDKKGDGYIVKSKKIGNFTEYSRYDPKTEDSYYIVNGKRAVFENRDPTGKSEVAKQCYITTEGNGFCMGFTDADFD